jgi:phage shock protein PspC (stress-responsive transcriptional regulator)
MEPKRLYRSITDRKLAGVAGGLAEYFVMDPLLIRLAFVLLTLAGGGGFLIYIILWIVTPDNPIRISQPINQPDQYAQQTTDNNPDFTADPMNSGTTATSTPVPQTKERKNGSLIGGLVLITLGALFLADELIPQVNFGDLWPVILIVIGIGLLVNTVTKKNRDKNQY